MAPGLRPATMRPLEDTEVIEPREYRTLTARLLRGGYSLAPDTEGAPGILTYAFRSQAVIWGTDSVAYSPVARPG